MFAVLLLRDEARPNPAALEGFVVAGAVAGRGGSFKLGVGFADRGGCGDGLVISPDLCGMIWPCKLRGTPLVRMVSRLQMAFCRWPRRALQAAGHTFVVHLPFKVGARGRLLVLRGAHVALMGVFQREPAPGAAGVKKRGRGFEDEGMWEVLGPLFEMQVIDAIKW